MKSPRAFVLLDVDDTILDFRKAEAVALSKALAERKIEPTPAIIERYSQINKSQWELLEEGRLTREQVLLRRFELLFEELGLDLSPERMRGAGAAVGAVRKICAVHCLQRYGQCPGGTACQRRNREFL